MNAQTAKITPGPWRVEFGDDGDVYGIYPGEARIVETDSGVYPPKASDARNAIQRATGEQP